MRASRPYPVGDGGCRLQYDRAHERPDRGHEPVDQARETRRLRIPEPGQLPATGTVALHPAHPADCQRGTRRCPPKIEEPDSVAEGSGISRKASVNGQILTSHQRGPAPGHQRGLLHGHGQPVTAAGSACKARDLPSTTPVTCYACIFIRCTRLLEHRMAHPQGRANPHTSASTVTSQP